MSVAKLQCRNITCIDINTHQIASKGTDTTTAVCKKVKKSEEERRCYKEVTRKSLILFVIVRETSHGERVHTGIGLEGELEAERVICGGKGSGRSGGGSWESRQHHAVSTARNPEENIRFGQED